MFANEGAFILAALLLNISPGPDHIYILGRTLVQGKFVGFVSSWGVCTGAMIHVLAAAFGFSLIIKSSPVVYSAFKYAGAGYLLYMGINQFRHSAAVQINKGQGRDVQSLSLGKVYLQGIMIDVFNPKVALFFLAFLPQFISKESSDQVIPFIILGLVVIIIAIVWEAVIILFSALILGRFLHSVRFVNFLNYFMGLVFIFLAIQFALL